MKPINLNNQSLSNILSVLQDAGVDVTKESFLELVNELPRVEDNTEKIETLLKNIAPSLEEVMMKGLQVMKLSEIINTNLSDSFHDVCANLMEGMARVAMYVGHYAEQDDLANLEMLCKLYHQDLRHRAHAILVDIMKMLHSQKFVDSHGPNQPLSPADTNHAHLLVALYYREVPVELYGNSDSKSIGDIIIGIREYVYQVNQQITAF